ncbi:hypothetical protein ACFVUY_02155 [Kitasatospora sp. NPDC058063]|uniref:hypothetical protein n=1 Tax=unclassified Kitasatospora TaxID=2633591 RepID=UPI0036DB8F96
MVEIPFPVDREDYPDLGVDDFCLLDLSSVSEDSYPKAADLLSEFWGRTEDGKARLAAVLPSVNDDLVSPQLRTLVAQIGRPRELAVLRRHLDAEGVPYDPEELREFDFLDQLANLAMRDIQRLAILTGQARALDGPAGIHDWLTTALAAWSNRSGDVAQVVAAIDSGRQRALLLAAAMLEGAPTDAVFRHAEALLGKVEHTPDEKPGFERPDLAERLAELPVDVDSTGRIRFTSLAYGGAVRSHFWSYFPGFRKQFGAWVADTVKDQRRCLDLEDRAKFLGRFTDQSLRVGELGVLQQLAGTWAADSALQDEAMLVLERVLSHEVHGASFRGWIYEQVTKGTLEPSTVQTLVRVCTEVLAPSHPEQALVRIHHMARRAPKARGPLLEMGRSEAWLYLRLLTRVCEGMEKQNPWLPDVEIFLSLVSHLPEWVRSQDVVRGWRSVLGLVPPTKWASGVGAWLSAARQECDSGERLAGILIDAADGRITLLSHYYLLAHDWATEPDDAPGLPTRADVAARFCRRIDHAQGIGPLVGANGGRGL